MIEKFQDSLLELIPPPVLWVVFLIVLAAFAVITVALMYHWKYYGVEENAHKKIGRAYFTVSAVFIGAMLISLIAYSL